MKPPSRSIGCWTRQGEESGCTEKTGGNQRAERVIQNMEYITESPIIPENEVHQINAEGSGSLIYHFAIVKSLADDNVKETTTAISYERVGDIEAELASISADLRDKWNVDDVLLIRRIGILQVGDIISLIAISASRSKDAFEACQYGLQRIKKMATIKKQEVYAVNPL